MTVNILTNHAVTNGRIRVFGGSQYRPNIHIEDITDLYVQLLTLPDEALAGRVWNAGYENQTVADIAAQVQGVIGAGHVEIATEPTDDLRSYRISSERIKQEIGFVPRHSVRDAVGDLAEAFEAGLIPGAMTDDRYYNVRVMKKLPLGP